ncbi:MAG: hypothetical protein Q7S34_01650 [bacterium]|nr:hypothetical protein [bacterium]
MDTLMQKVISSFLNDVDEFVRRVKRENHVGIGIMVSVSQMEEKIKIFRGELGIKDLSVSSKSVVQRPTQVL